jgi:hypothetical protein
MQRIICKASGSVSCHLNTTLRYCCLEQKQHIIRRCSPEEYPRANPLLTRPARHGLRRGCRARALRGHPGEAVSGQRARLAAYAQHGEAVGQGGGSQRRLTTDAPAQPLLFLALLGDDEAVIVFNGVRDGEGVVGRDNLVVCREEPGWRERKRRRHRLRRRGTAAGAKLPLGCLGHAGAVLPREGHRGGGGVQRGEEEAVVERRGRPREGEEGGGGRGRRRW